MSDSIQYRSVKVLDGTTQIRVRVEGVGPPLVYLHPAAGLAWDDFLTRLARDYTVYAPEFPGTTPGVPYAGTHFSDLWDIVLAYEELLNTLEVRNPVLVGQSFGGMLACELAAVYPSIVRQLVVLDPVGVWNEEYPIADWISAPPETLPAMLFKNPSGSAATMALALPDGAEERIKAAAGMVWNIGCTGRFLWPIPDRGLRKRLYRVKAPTLIVWGDSDALIPPQYADEFKRHISNSEVVIIPNCGHIPQIECTTETYAAVSSFLAKCSKEQNPSI